MQNLWIKNLIIFSVLLIVTNACVMTPTGEIIAPPLDVSATVDFTPHYVYRNRSGVTISIGPDYTIGDAFLLADDHCSSYGYFAVPASDWDYRYSSVRRLEYYCRSNSSYLPPVIISSRTSRYFGRPYRLYDDHNHRYYPRSDRRYNHNDDRYNSPRPSGGWWSRNRNDDHNNRRVTPTPPVHTPRATTPQSPWSYNPRKEDNGRHRDHRPSYGSSRDRGGERGSSSRSTGSGWWGRNNRSSSTSSSGSSSSRGSSYSKPSSNNSSSRSDSHLNPYSSSSRSSSNSSGAAPGWWGKNKK